MDLLQMRYFISIVDCGTMTAAAQSLHVSQSTLSCSVKKLEEELDVMLFRKLGRNIVCTDAGEVFYKTAKEILEQTDRLRTTIKEFNSERRNAVHVVFDVVDIATESTALLRRGKTNFDIHLVRRLQIPESHRYFLSGKADFLITSEPLTSEHSAGELLYEDPIMAIVSTEHAIARMNNVPILSLANEVFVTLKEGSSIRVLHDAIFREAGIKKPKLYIVNDPETIPFSVSKNMGIAFLPRSVRNYQMLPNANFTIKNIVTVALKEVQFSKKVYLYWKKGFEDSAEFRFYHSALRQYADYIINHGVLPTTPEQLGMTTAATEA